MPKYIFKINLTTGKLPTNIDYETTVYVCRVRAEGEAEAVRNLMSYFEEGSLQMETEGRYRILPYIFTVEVCGKEPDNSHGVLEVKTKKYPEEE